MTGSQKPENGFKKSKWPVFERPKTSPSYKRQLRTYKWNVYFVTTNVRLHYYFSCWQTFSTHSVSVWIQYYSSYCNSSFKRKEKEFAAVVFKLLVYWFTYFLMKSFEHESQCWNNQFKAIKNFKRRSSCRITIGQVSYVTLNFFSLTLHRLRDWYMHTIWRNDTKSYLNGSCFSRSIFKMLGIYQKKFFGL